MENVRVFKDGDNRSIIVVDGDNEEVLATINKALAGESGVIEVEGVKPPPPPDAATESSENVSTAEEPDVTETEETFIVDSLDNLVEGFRRAIEAKGDEKEELVEMCKSFIKYKFDECISEFWLVEEKILVLDTLAPMVSLDSFTQKLGFVSYESMKDTGEDGDASLINSEEIEQLYDAVVESIRARGR